jgi:hypothetical protein
MKMTAFWDAELCSFVEIDLSCRYDYHLHHQGEECSSLIGLTVVVVQFSRHNGSSERNFYVLHLV